MKKLSLHLLLLLTLAAGISSCQKTELEPKAPGNATATQNLAYWTVESRCGYLFLRTPGPFNLGHTGVGFILKYTWYDPATQVTTVRYTPYCGGVENPKGTPVIAPGLPNGGWFNSGGGGNNNTEADAVEFLKSSMKQKGYTKYKHELSGGSTLLPSDTDQGNAARNIIAKFPNRGYNVVGNNCMDASYEVLQALGVSGMASPKTDWRPTQQFNSTGRRGGWSDASNL